MLPILRFWKCTKSSGTTRKVFSQSYDRRSLPVSKKIYGTE